MSCDADAVMKRLAAAKVGTRLRCRAAFDSDVVLPDSAPCFSLV